MKNKRFCQLTYVLRILFFSVLTVWGGAVAAFAHPHIWIDARTSISFNDDGAIIAITHDWLFDEAFSSWSIQGLDTDGDGEISAAEFEELALENASGLAEYEYYTFAGDAGRDVAFSALPNTQMTYDGSRTTLRLSLVPDQPIVVGPLFELEVTDPEYYVAFTFLTDGGVTLINAPETCSAEVNEPRPIDPDLADRLFELGPEVTELPADLRGIAADLANVVLVRCEGASPQSALEATERLVRGSGSPFSAPPVEVGLPLVRTGFLGWINEQQQNFYGALTQALSQLKVDGNAFWILGSLSFLYGAFHAAGPGHGKVVISSYMLATETELRRGIGLSFASGMLQSVTAIVFVLVAALVLNMTSVRLSETSDFLITGSYALVMLLGIWLIMRKVFGLGHHHNHDAHDHDNHDHDHAHDHDDHDHAHHMILPSQVKGSWREILGVVFAVGLRPCSGALVVLVFALSQGLLAAGIVAVFLMGIGTSLTVGILATVAVGAKGIVGLLSGGKHSGLAQHVFWWLELLGAVLVFGFGVVLLLASI